MAIIGVYPIFRHTHVWDWPQFGALSMVWIVIGYFHDLVSQSSSEDRFNSMIQIWNIIWKAHDFEYTIYIYINIYLFKWYWDWTATNCPESISLSITKTDSKATNSRRWFLHCADLNQTSLGQEPTGGRSNGRLQTYVAHQGSSYLVKKKCKKSGKALAHQNLQVDVLIAAKLIEIDHHERIWKAWLVPPWLRLRAS